QTSIRTLFPTIGIAGDSMTGQLIVVAPTHVQAEVAEIVEMINRGPNAAENSIAVFQVDPKQATLPNVLTALQATVPTQVRLEANPSSNSILAIGTSADLDTVRVLLTELLRQMPPPPRTTSRVYELQHTNSATVVSLLTGLLPGVPLAQDPNLRALAATALEEEHARIDEFLQVFDVPRPPTGRTVQTYPVAFGEMATLPNLLTQLAPQAVISSDPATRTITVWADAESHTRIEQAIRKVAQTAEQATVPVNYAVRPSQIAAVQMALRSLFPTLAVSADTTTGQLIIVASLGIHKRVSEVVELLANGPRAEERTTAILQVEPEQASLPELFTAL
ncbi:MAG: hypothetical protein NXI32_31540, partial [bacterium]|nr:hypothetical protein [bacterium]